MECKEIFSSDLILQRHIIDIHTGEKPVACTDSNYIFLQNIDQSNENNDQINIPTGEKPVACTDGNDIFSQNIDHSDENNERKNILPGENPVACEDSSELILRIIMTVIK